MAFDASSRQQPAADTTVAAVNHFVRLMDSIKGDWDDVVTQVHAPTTSLARLQLETVALMRGLCGNTLVEEQPHASTSRQTLDVEVGDTAFTSAATSRRHGHLQRSNRELASSRLVSLEGDLLGLRESMEQLYACSNTMLHAASSVVQELDQIHGQVQKLKNSNSSTARPSVPNDWSSAAMKQAKTTLELTVPTSPMRRLSDTPSSSYSPSASECADDEDEDNDPAYLEDLIYGGPFSAGPEYGEEDGDDVDVSGDWNARPQSSASDDEDEETSKPGSLMLRGAPAFGEGCSPAALSSGAALPLEGSLKPRRRDYFGDWTRRRRGDGPMHVDTGPAGNGGLSLRQMSVEMGEEEEDYSEPEDSGLLRLGLKRRSSEDELGGTARSPKAMRLVM